MNHDTNNHIINYLKQLISYASVTPANKDIILFINNIFIKNGFTTIIKTFGNDKYKVSNIYAYYNKLNTPNICFAGHVDVVEPGDNKLWITNPFEAVIKQDMIFGRGAVDMKGAIACQISAALNFIKKYQSFKGNISFLITCDEEGSAKYGTKKMLQYIYKKGHKIDFVILGEPTSCNTIGDRIKLGRRGSINYLLSVYNTQGHVAYIDPKNNPIHIATSIINNLITLTLDNGNEHFSPSCIQITSIDVNNTSTNIVPSKISCNFNIRFNNLHTKISLQKMITGIIKQYTSNYKLYIVSFNECFLQTSNKYTKMFIETITETLNINPHFSCDGGTSDARFIKDYCTVLECGLKSETAHKTNEYTKINDLQSLYNVYYNFLYKTLICIE